MRVAAWQIKLDPKNCIFNPSPARLHHIRCWSKGRKISCKVFPHKSSADFNSSLAHCHQPLPVLHQLLSSQLHRLSSSHMGLEEMASGQGSIWSWVFSASGGRFFHCLFFPLFSPQHDSQCKTNIVEFIPLYEYPYLPVLKMPSPVSCQPTCTSLPQAVMFYSYSTHTLHNGCASVPQSLLFSSGGNQNGADPSTFCPAH